MSTREDEHERLRGVYAGMSEEELEQIAADGYELSDVAQEALAAEIGKRGLAIAIAMPPAVDGYEFTPMVTVRAFRDLPEALLAKASLESAGIEAVLADDNMVRMDWFYSNLLGGIKLKVNPGDAGAANEILQLPIPEEIEIGEAEAYQQPRCPRCQSIDVSYRELNKPVSFGTAYLGVPIPVHVKDWNCHACHHHWKDEPSPEPPEETGGE